MSLRVESGAFVCGISFDEYPANRLDRGASLVFSQLVQAVDDRAVEPSQDLRISGNLGSRGIKRPAKKIEGCSRLLNTGTGRQIKTPSKVYDSTNDINIAFASFALEFFAGELQTSLRI